MNRHRSLITPSVCPHATQRSYYCSTTSVLHACPEQSPLTRHFHISPISPHAWRCGLVLEMSIHSMHMCVCLRASHDREPCKNSLTNRDALCGSRGPNKPLLNEYLHMGATWQIRLNDPWSVLFGRCCCCHHYRSNLLIHRTLRYQ